MCSRLAVVYGIFDSHHKTSLQRKLRVRKISLPFGTSCRKQKTVGWESSSMVFVFAGETHSRVRLEQADGLHRHLP